jgi:hypothetical protein
MNSAPVVCVENSETQPSADESRPANRLANLLAIVRREQQVVAADCARLIEISAPTAEHAPEAN